MGPAFISTNRIRIQLRPLQGNVAETSVLRRRLDCNHQKLHTIIIMLTTETRLLIEHWPAVEEIIQTVDTLKTQLSELLSSLKDDLNKTDWWSEDWSFVRHTDEQVYIAHNTWRYNKSDYAVWIGIEQFVPSVLFGKAVFPQLYVWSSISDKQFIGKAREIFRSKKILGTVDEKKGSYIIKHFLPKILPG